MRFEKDVMLFAGLEMMRCKRNRENRNSGCQLSMHQSIDDRLCDKVMTVDATVHHQRSTDDGVISATAAKLFCKQGHLESAGHIDCRNLHPLAGCCDFRFETGKGLIYDLGMPSCFYECNLESFSHGTILHLE